MSAQDLENFFVNLTNEQKQYICNQTIENNEFKIEKYLVSRISTGMHLNRWMWISDNLIAHCMQENIVDDFYAVYQEIMITEMPGRLPNLDQAFKDLAHHMFLLLEHITDRNFTDLLGGFWKIDMRWKRIWMDNSIEYDQKYKTYNEWRKKLYYLHNNLAHALNLVSYEIKKYIDPDFFMGKKFGVNDSIGTYNEMEPAYTIPLDYYEVAE